MRELKFHEQKLLKKLNFFDYKRERNVHEGEIMKTFAIKKRVEYLQYVKHARSIYNVVSVLRKLPKDDPIRIEITNQITTKLFNMGLLSDKKASLSALLSISASQFASRRLSTIVVRKKMADSMKKAVDIIEHGHIRIGPSVVTDPATHVSRDMDDMVTWIAGSRFKRTIDEFHIS
eukprot:gnl/Carplike_NY0171/8359_a11592_168.p1 GENE.gnl/Carplike_NY0171/8359_a11592_168~~gnl/Carplike_NY0171/8359_a11592_168.p1  ORF type:complete len:186 (-),score=28.22 gnl/Carplike_NY0171/8359_a11592_168:13-540(-)